MVTREDTDVAVVVETCSMRLDMMLITRRMKLLIIIKSNKMTKAKIRKLLKKRKYQRLLDLLLDSEAAEVEEEAEVEEVAFKAQIVMMIELMTISKIHKEATAVEEEISIMDTLKTIEAVAVVEEEGTEDVVGEQTLPPGMIRISMKTSLRREEGND